MESNELLNKLVDATLNRAKELNDASAQELQRLRNIETMAFKLVSAEQKYGRHSPVFWMRFGVLVNLLEGEDESGLR